MRSGVREAYVYASNRVLINDAAVHDDCENFGAKFDHDRGYVTITTAVTGRNVIAYSQ